jgi:hypothetical protein
VLERLLAGLSPGAKRGVTIALIAVAWIGFLVAVIGGLLEGLVILVVGFVGCWLVVATLAGKTSSPDRDQEPLLREADEDPRDVQSRVRKRLEAMQDTEPPDEPAS